MAQNPFRFRFGCLDLKCVGARRIRFARYSGCAVEDGLWIVLDESEATFECVKVFFCWEQLLEGVVACDNDLLWSQLFVAALDLCWEGVAV